LQAARRDSTASANIQMLLPHIAWFPVLWTAKCC
jgi:hypothetical protein